MFGREPSSLTPLHDNDEAFGAVDHALDAVVLVSGNEKEAQWVAPYSLVLGARGLDRLGAVAPATLAYEAGEPVFLVVVGKAARYVLDANSRDS